MQLIDLIFCVVPHAYIFVRQLNRDGRDKMYTLIIIFHNFKFCTCILLMEWSWAMPKLMTTVVSDKINNLIVSEMKKIIKNVTDGTII